VLPFDGLIVAASSTPGAFRVCRGVALTAAARGICRAAGAQVMVTGLAALKKLNAQLSDSLPGSVTGTAGLRFICYYQKRQKTSINPAKKREWCLHKLAVP
jgi:hypothetical protein